VNSHQSSVSSHQLSVKVVIGKLGNWGIGSHKTHKVKLVKVHYPWHPLYNEEVQNLSTVTRGGEKYYKIRLADSSCILLPSWMTDQSFCRRFVLRPDPYCSVAGLLELRHLLSCLEK
jgi:hypothetical protein